MTITNHTKEQAREFLKQEALKEITKDSNFAGFYTRVFYVMAKYGLQLKAKEDNFFSGDEWNDPASMDVLIEKVKQFLDIHIK